MADYQAKKAALQQRLKVLDADEARIAVKRKQTEAGIAECDRMIAGGASKAPKAAKRAGRKRA
jgi:hypothetical protein